MNRFNFLSRNTSKRASGAGQDRKRPVLGCAIGCSFNQSAPRYLLLGRYL
jgi:hypothetical protein